jgi:hypothetical protein
LPPSSGPKNKPSKKPASVDVQRTARCYILEDSTLHNHCCENLKSYIVFLYGEATHQYIRWLCLLSAFTLVSCLAYSLALKMEVICSSETSVDFQQSTRHYIPEARMLYNHCCENLKSKSKSHYDQRPVGQ